MISITDADGTRDYTVFPSSKARDRLGSQYCREVGSPPVLECVELRSWGFELARYTSSEPDTGSVCYSATYASQADAAPADETGEEESEEGEGGDGADENTLAGTYAGSTDLPTQWADSPGRDTANEIVVAVADDGTVTGSLTVVRVGDAYTVPDGDCTTYTDFAVDGTLSGQLTDVNGTIAIHMIYSFETRYTGGCPGDPAEHTEEYDLRAEIRIAGDRMTGTVPEFFSFEATRQ
jgi:hypothetical protein